MNKIDIINLGCSKNLVDAERLYTQLRSNGVSVKLNPETITADTVIINTCGFIGDAKEESIDVIMETVGLKNNNPNAKVFVMGCLSERYRSELEEEVPEVDQYYGVNDLQKIISDLGYTYRQDKLLHRNHSTPSHYAFLKIAEGCDRNCAFCAIPMIRGQQVSKTIDDLVEEARHLSTKGVKELILISQELTRYGLDIYRKPELVSLLEKLNDIEGVEWIRLQYTYPNLFKKDLIRAIAELPKVCHYLDMPFQHFNDHVLSMMKRAHTKDDALRLIGDIRQAVPDIALRTTLLTGHPGENDQAFEELLDAVRQIRFDRLGVFTYSHEENTFAWRTYKDEIPEHVKRDRADILMNLQQQISLEINETKIGSVHKVLIDKLEGDYFVGRTQYDSPEIDNEVLILQHDNDLRIGSFYEIRITGAEEFDLFGTPST